MEKQNQLVKSDACHQLCWVGTTVTSVSITDKFVCILANNLTHITLQNIFDKSFEPSIINSTSMFQNSVTTTEET